MKVTNTLKNVLFPFSFLCLLIFTGCNPEDTEPEIIPETTINKALLLQLVNEYRQNGCRCGDTDFEPTTALSWSYTLELVALDHTIDMEKHGFLLHTGSDGSDVDVRAIRRNYDWGFIGENIARYFYTEQSVIIGWIESPDHCENIMNPNYRDMGIARVGDYWTQVMGKLR